MIKKVLVVGGAGYIGGAVTDELIKQKISFTVYDNLTYENHYFKSVDFVLGDVRDYRKLKKLLPKYSHVVWLAAIVGDGASSINPVLTKEINEDSVAFLARNFKGRIIFTSTCSVYGVNEKVMDEESETNPLSVYARTKLDAENHLKNKNALILRLGTAFGISDTYSRIRMDLALNYMTMNALKRKELTVFGGKQWRPFMHVKDIGKAIVDNLDKKNIGIYNIATHNSTIIELVREIKKETKCKVINSIKKFEDNRSYNASVEKAKKAGILSFKNKLSLRSGVREIVTLVNSGRVKNLDYEAYSNEQSLLKFIVEERGM